MAEKPSVGRDLARVLGARTKGEGYFEGEDLVVTWCVGHVAELEEPAHYQAAWRRWSLETLPMLPESFEIRPRKGVSDQLAVVRRLVRQGAVEAVVNACDAGREGELIFRWAMELAGCKKPAFRLWISSLTDEAIRDGWARLRPSADFDRLADAARSRAESDWLVGLNATRALTCVARDVGGADTLSVGRVQTPTLAMIVGRDREIAAFVPQTFWQIKARFEAAAGSWDGTWFATGEPTAPQEAPAEGAEEVAPVAERVADRATAEAIAAAAADRPGTVVQADRRRTVEKPPLLYDLTSLQRRANQRYGLSAPRTLEIAQALYERHKLITYPRTDARFITPDQVPGLPKIVEGLRPVAPYRAAADALLAGPISPGRRVVNPAEVGDHHAILPTGRTPSSDRLDPDEKRVFDLVARRFLAALGEDAWFDVTTLVVHVPPAAPVAGVAAPLAFRARGRVCRRAGWREIDPPGASRDVDLPPVETGDPATCREPRVLEGQTRPPRPHSDATILRAMETAGRELDDEALVRRMRSCGLGTPATRAAILETLVERKYVERKGRDLRATDRGCAVIDAVTVDELKSAELTGRWEGLLSEVAEGRADRTQFMADVRVNVAAIVREIATHPPPRLEAIQGAELGRCPKCGRQVRARGRGWGCEAGCGYQIPGIVARRPISARMAKQLLAEGRTPVVKGFKSREGKEFSAGLRWDPDGGRVAFWFPDRAERAPASLPRLRAGDPCPSCGKGRIVQGRTALGCDRWRAGCTFVQR